MMLNKFLDKAVDAAKESARQMYGYELSDLKQIIPDQTKKENASRQKGNLKQLAEGMGKKGVTFDWSGGGKTGGIESKMASIRKYAAQQADSEAGEIGSQNPGQGTLQHPQETAEKMTTAPNQVYSRKDIQVKPLDDNEARGRNMMLYEENIDKQAESPGKQEQATPPYTAVPAQSKTSSAENDKPAEAGEEQSLHERLDRLESLMHLTLSSDDLTYASHPAYHKLLHKGVPKRLITKWFQDLCSQGIQPDKQEELLSTKLSLIIQEEMAAAQAVKIKKQLLFTGRAGSGKTHLIMKLCRHPQLMPKKNIAVASVEPKVESGRPYYTILDPFCRDNEIPYINLQEADDVSVLQEMGAAFDHILIDTPSPEALNDSLFNKFLDIIQKLQSLNEVETHYLINTAVHGVAFKDPLASQLKADHLAPTHIDMSNRWGEIVQLITQTDYRMRFTSSGEYTPDSLHPFNPEHFTKRLMT